MNIHINKNTRIQSWEKKTIFGEYPVHLRPGNFTVTLLFHDAGSILRLCEVLTDTLAQIEAEESLKKLGLKETPYPFNDN